ncbi:Polymer-forming protein [Microbacterium hydrothermale]|uniref:polymer-forming cytoskeletal protein n=1 Tax=Microbacterium hydrothermale TaxID=857427 RepID=UPI002226EB28|nr:polymer-forming cytoskeletal protein [Microbacterium hydrothermale]MCW2165409.1 Polymer-forming protein [Microbacterium hydrothermale]
MIINTNDSPMEDLRDAVTRQRRENPFESSSVRDGRVRFIKGLLRVEAGGRVEIVGTLQVDGTSTVTGSFTVSGPWKLTGDGSITGQLTITGPVTISGDVDLTGTMTVTGDIEISGPGKIKVGNVILEDGKIKAGGMTINPDVNGGQIDFGGGRSVNAGTGFLGLYDGDRFVVFNGSGVTMVAGGRSLSVGPSGIRATGMGTISQADVPDSFPNAVVAGPDGLLTRVVPGA